MSNNFRINLILLILPILLVVIFPSAYFNVWYDSEPDYISNALSIYNNGYPIDYHHPGIPITYIISAILWIYPDIDSIGGLVNYSRLLLLYLNFIIIGLTFRYLLDNNLKKFIVFMSVYLLYPAGHYFIDVISPNILLGSLGLLLMLLGYDIWKAKYKYQVLYAIILGVGVSIKFTFIVVALPLIISVVLSAGSLSNNLNFKRLGITVMLFILIAVALMAPLLLLIPLNATNLYNAYAMHVGQENIYNGLIVSSVLLVLIMALIAYIYNKQIFVDYRKSYKSVCGVIVLLIMGDIIIDAATLPAIRDIAIGDRHIFPLIGAVAIIDTKELFSSNKAYHALVIVFAVAVIMKLNANHVDMVSSAQINDDFHNDLNNHLESNRDVVLYPASDFISKDYFILWADYRYGNKTDRFVLDRKLDNLVPEGFHKLNVLNSRKFSANKDISETFTYRYVSLLAGFEFIPVVFKEQLLIFLGSLGSRDICSEPYDGYAGNNFRVLIPGNLRFDNVDKNTSKISADTYGYAKRLANDWVRKCSFNISITEGNLGNNKVVIIDVFSNDIMRND